MASSALETWTEANQRHLASLVDRVRAALVRRAGRSSDDVPAAVPAGQPTSGVEPPAIESLGSAFHLSPFERDVLVLCAGMELAGDFAELCASAHGDTAARYPTFGLALAALPEPHWSAVTPGAPLRNWRLIELQPGGSLMTSPLRIDEFVLHYLAGVRQLDGRIAGNLSVCQPSGDLVPSHEATARQIVETWKRARPPSLPIVQLCGEDPSAKLSVAAAACTSLGMSLWRLPVEALPASPTDLDTFVRLWNRQSALGTGGLLVDCDDPDLDESTRGAATWRVAERIVGPVIVSSRERRRFRMRQSVAIDVGRPTSAEQRRVWELALAPAAAVDGAAQALSAGIDQLSSQFSLGSRAIREVGLEAVSRVSPANAHDVGRIAWDTCRSRSRPRLDDLAQRIEPGAGWDDLVLPEPQVQILRDIAVHVRQRTKVYEAWGFAARGSRGLGISALFSGASGTGKTMAAEVLANELRLDLYRIDLSAVVSKYIGETEKNLRRVFDAAEESGAILLFDEADALFGKRSEVKDSHDRYANIEVSYLLQRMESYRGLAILTTNMKSALDAAFLRRIRFLVQFPFPDALQRAEIWRRIFPPQTPTEGLLASRLAQLTVSGGNIRSIALGAAFLAADSGEPVRMSHVLRAARSEYAKLEKPLTEGESAGWV